MPTLSTTLGKNMQLKAQFGHKSRPAGGNFGLQVDLQVCCARLTHRSIDARLVGVLG